MAQKPKDKSSVDAIPFVVGVITLLKQFHSVYTQQFLAYLGQYVRSLINITVGGYSSLPTHLFLSMLTDTTRTTHTPHTHDTRTHKQRRQGTHAGLPGGGGQHPAVPGGVLPVQQDGPEGGGGLPPALCLRPVHSLSLISSPISRPPRPPNQTNVTRLFKQPLLNFNFSSVSLEISISL